jgi:acyl-CoA synthetase (AMP-forming)/AMP-acid ligase II
MIISGGVNIYPAEIEKELLEHPAIAEVSVIGAADEKWGEVPVAFVALKSHATTSDVELIEFLRPRINKIKLPRHVIFTKTLPRNAYGKVLKLELQERLRNLKSGAAGETST